MKNETIRKQLAILGCDTAYDTAVFGRYFDGTDHEYTCEVIRFSYDFTLNGYGQYNEVMGFLDRFGRRARNYRVHLTSSTYSGRIAGYVIGSEDDEKACTAMTIANKFQNAFWQARHEGKTAGQCIIAGREAIA